jgi:hypothetical protein
MDSETKKTPRTLTYTFTVDDDFADDAQVKVETVCDPPISILDISCGSAIGGVYYAFELGLQQLEAMGIRALSEKMGVPVTTTVQ